MLYFDIFQSECNIYSDIYSEFVKNTKIIINKSNYIVGIFVDIVNICLFQTFPLSSLFQTKKI